MRDNNTGISITQTENLRLQRPYEKISPDEVLRAEKHFVIASFVRIFSALTHLLVLTALGTIDRQNTCSQNC